MSGFERWARLRGLRGRLDRIAIGFGDYVAGYLGSEKIQDGYIDEREMLECNARLLREAADLIDDELKTWPSKESP